ncbi:hypothetical protein NAF17_09510 [Mucilaginibacter sp. RB4R14]|uniref:hypothetical protein n=1 Tax=Mucilaginibacter aurantiaciroseus TaxID=2949308 RepID=UPI00209181D2|nr:hypothetical protein [Mucilaginibacter aurantiaciroseus]MCO5935779.1 hypothetical protein [Mucilaginibacter aurantiaciroseus]
MDAINPKFLLDELGKADKSQLRIGATHMDIWFDNFNITKEGQINLFDFDFCGEWLAVLRYCLLHFTIE